MHILPPNCDSAASFVHTPISDLQEHRNAKQQTNLNKLLIFFSISVSSCSCLAEQATYEISREWSRPTFDSQPGPFVKSTLCYCSLKGQKYISTGTLPNLNKLHFWKPSRYSWRPDRLFPLEVKSWSHCHNKLRENRRERMTKLKG